MASENVEEHPQILRWRRFFVKPDASAQRRIARLHVIATGHPRWVQQIAFRNAQGCDEQLAKRYTNLKYQLAARYQDDREAYTDGKAKFITSALQQSAGR